MLPQSLPSKFDRSMCRTRLRGFTLIEVLVGMLLLATLAVMTLQGFRSHKLQLRFAEQRIVAIAELDRLLSLWSSNPAGFPMTGFGPMSPTSPWAWKASVVGQQSVFGQSVNIVRIEIFEGTSAESRRLCFVELLKLNEP